jgi:hypothetical protein
MDLLRKYGKEVWLITQADDAQRPIFTSCTDNIIELPQVQRTAPRKEKKTVKPRKDSLPAGEKRPPLEEDGESAKDKTAEELFKRVLVSLDPSEEHQLTVIANKMRQLDKSFKIKNTGYKKMTNLAKEFEKKGWFKAIKSKEGHMMIIDLDVSR